jgi:hypothetical protein
MARHTTIYHLKHMIVGQIPTRNEIESMIWDMECFDVFTDSIAEIALKSPGLWTLPIGEA